MITIKTHNIKDIKKFINKKKLDEFVSQKIKNKYMIVKQEWKALKHKFDNLDDWKLVVEIRLNKSWLGLCNYQEKIIYIHIRHLYYDHIKDCKDTIRHEVAHILSPDDVDDGGHGIIWKHKCKLTKAKPIKCSKSNVQYPLLLSCDTDNCFKMKYKRKNKKWDNPDFDNHCCYCNTKISYKKNDRFVF